MARGEGEGCLGELVLVSGNLLKTVTSESRSQLPTNELRCNAVMVRQGHRRLL